MKENSNLTQLFDLEPLPDSLSSIPAPTNNEEDQEDDYQLARQTLRRLIMKGENTLDDMMELARNSEHPRTYEVAGQLMKTMSDMSKDLIGLQKQVKDLRADSPKSIKNTQNNVVFAGSTQDLLKFLKSKDV